MASVPSNLTLSASARATISFDELAKEFDLPDRAEGWGSLPHDENGTLLLDGVRKRPRYFDGKFLTAADLTRDQDYIRQRQDDLARATGTGVVRGLHVAVDPKGSGDQITISSGHGVTPSGAIVSIMSERNVALLDIAGSRRLDQVLGLSSSPAIPVNARTGLFMLALRPVEFTANPTGSYPDATSGERSSEPGDIIEATAITLIAYEGAGEVADLTSARTAAASDIFGRSPGTLPQDALLLAMLALDRGNIVWCDPMLVRRETGADSPLALGLGGRARAVSEAFLLQYQQHLADVMQMRASRGEGQSFAAQDHFDLIPPAGPMPLGSILTGTDSLEQAWLPPEVDMQVSFVPEDEIGAVIEDSLGLEPIDLAKASNEGLAVSALVPLPRHRLHSLAHSLRSLTMPILSPRAYGSGFGAISDARGTGGWRRLRRTGRLRPGSILDRSEAAQLSLWEASLQDAVKSVPRDPNGNPVLFYARQRTAPHAATLTGHSIQLLSEEPKPVDPVIDEPTDEDSDPDTPTPTPTPGPSPSPSPSPSPTPAPNGEEAREKLVAEKAAKLQLKQRLGTLRKTIVSGGNAALTDLLAQKTMGDVLFTNLVRDLEIVSPKIETDKSLLEVLKARNALLETRFRRRREETKMLSKSDVATIGGDYRRDDLGRGLRVLAKVSDKSLISGKAGVWLGDTALGIEVDRILANARDRRVQNVAMKLAELIKAQEEKELRNLMFELMKEH